jgi:NAD(P)-dependent dehydrogenase (short-subunit alcohol dehydrogenase family)
VAGLEIKNQVVLVTAANRGIGRSTLSRRPGQYSVRANDGRREAAPGRFPTDLPVDQALSESCRSRRSTHSEAERP